ncbi:M43 family zinc metalloprotease [Crocinitomix algicola]|uniref:M43 family zinc metalloprotease n=1 Tax=Crocinitomix algicola TaxID=1740263 RepID=UPI0015869228|nr:M43 family zinc metalloprotease [Crocinitomix algicola]
MKKLNLMLGLITGCMFAHQSFSQDQFNCGLPEKMEGLYEAYPNLERDQQELIERSKTYSHDRDGEVLVIPVVFHIIHDNGVENISDEQIFDQMAILNRDYRKLNADTVDIMDEFKTIATDTRIEFKLANKDPFGNCTNGIDRIFSHETTIGDDYSKLNQWPRGRYLNVWVVKSMEGGVAGYAYYPSAVSTGLKYADGIIIRHNYIGSIGTSNSTNSRALTHEIGHWLGLPHTWGSTNSPEVACGDDGIEDTPETAGHSSCILVDTDNCNEGIAENIQNYMEYSYCSKMFTADQSAVMNTALANDLSQRNNLVTEESAINAGIDGDEVVTCTPSPDFFMDKDIFCAGNSIQFFPSISRATVNEYSWHFPGGTPEYSSETSPIVTYNTAGNYNVELTVSNEAGSETIVKNEIVHALGNYWEHEGPYSESFEGEGFTEDEWIVINPEHNAVKWEEIEFAGATGNKAIGLKYFIGDPDPIIQPHYYEQIGGTKDILISPSFNLSNTSAPVLSFKYIYATINAGVYSAEQINLKVSFWKECESSWTTLEILSNNDINCVGHKATGFFPNNEEAWQLVSIPLPPSATASNVRFKIELTAEDFSNNFLIDDFNIAGVLSNGKNQESLQQISIYPNPTTPSSTLNLSYYSIQENELDIMIYDMLGNLVYTNQIQANSGMNQSTIELDEQLSKGVYNIVINNSTSSFAQRLILN